MGGCIYIYIYTYTLRVQVPNNHIPTQKLYYNYYYPKPKDLIVGYLDPLGYMHILRAHRGDMAKWTLWDLNSAEDLKDYLWTPGVAEEFHLPDPKPLGPTKTQKTFRLLGACTSEPH